MSTDVLWIEHVWLDVARKEAWGWTGDHWENFGRAENFADACDLVFRMLKDHGIRALKEDRNLHTPRAQNPGSPSGDCVASGAQAADQ